MSTRREETIFTSEGGACQCAVSFMSVHTHDMQSLEILYGVRQYASLKIYLDDVRVQIRQGDRIRFEYTHATPFPILVAVILNEHELDEFIRGRFPLLVSSAQG